IKVRSLLSLIYSFFRFSSADRRTAVQFAIVAGTCALGLLLQCALLLYTTFGPKLSTPAGVSLALIFELVPAFALVATMRQPKLSAARSTHCPVVASLQSGKEE